MPRLLPLCVLKTGNPCGPCARLYSQSGPGLDTLHEEVTCEEEREFRTYLSSEKPQNPKGRVRSSMTRNYSAKDREHLRDSTRENTRDNNPEDSDSSIDEHPVAGGGNATAAGSFELPLPDENGDQNHYTSHDVKQKRKAGNYNSPSKTPSEATTSPIPKQGTYSRSTRPTTPQYPQKDTLERRPRRQEPDPSDSRRGSRARRQPEPAAESLEVPQKASRQHNQPPSSRQGRDRDRPHVYNHIPSRNRSNLGDEDDGTEELSVSMNLPDDPGPRSGHNTPRRRAASPAAAPPAPIGYNDADQFYQRSHPLDQEKPNNITASGARSPEKMQEARYSPLKQMINNPLNNSPHSPANPRYDAAPVQDDAEEDQHLSPWLSKEIGGLKEKYRGKSLLTKNAITDTFELDRHRDSEIRRLQEQIEDLECENKLKDRELDTNKWIEKEMDRKLQNADDVYQIKQAVKEKERQMDLHDKINRDLARENSILTEELADKEREVLQLQSEVDNLDRVIAAKNALREEETIKQLAKELDKMQDELERKELEINQEDKKNLISREQLARKEREVQYKDNKIADLGQEIVELKSEIGDKERQRLAQDERVKTLLRENDHLAEQDRKLAELRDQHAGLKEENDRLREKQRELEKQVRHLEGVNQEKNVLQATVDELRGVVDDKNRVEQERRRTAEQLMQTEAMLKDRHAEEEALHRELDQMRNYARELEKENGFYRDLEKDYQSVRAKYDDMERGKHKADRQLAQLRPRLQRLQNKSREKDDLVNRLANELRSRGDYLPPPLLSEVDRMNAAPLEDYGAGNTFEEEIEPQRHAPAQQAPPNSNQRRAQQRPKSHDLIQQLRPDLLDSDDSVRRPSRPSSRRQQNPQNQNPSRPYQSANIPSRRASPQANRSRNQSPEHEPRYHHKPERSRDDAGSMISLAPGTLLPSTSINKDEEAQKQQPPKQVLDAPTNFRIQKVLSDNSVMLEWLPPILDDLDRNNGLQVSGYKILVDDLEYQRVGSPRLNKALLNKLHLKANTKFGIQAYAVTGDSSMIEIATVSLDMLPENNYNSPMSPTLPKVDNHDDVFHHDRDAGRPLDGKRGLVPVNFIEEAPPAYMRNNEYDEYIPTRG